MDFTCQVDVTRAMIKLIKALAVHSIIRVLNISLDNSFTLCVRTASFLSLPILLCL